MDLLHALERSAKLASTSKVKRMLAHPGKYLEALLHRKLFYANTHKARAATAQTFYGAKLNILLPAATDIYLTGAKSHPTELRLAKFLIKNLKEGDVFIDIGAHYGYFSLLAESLVGGKGWVYSIEASKGTFILLQQNVWQSERVKPFHLAISDEPGTISFYEFPVFYSEYNSTDIEQFKDKHWFKKNVPGKIAVKATSLDAFIAENNITPAMIKIDVEGAEVKVIRGGLHYFRENNPLVIMEYLQPSRQNHQHRQAAQLMYDSGFESFTISDDGSLQKCSDIDGWLREQHLDSDNIVFKKST